MKKFDWYPCEIEPLGVLPFERCEILPGLVLFKLTDNEKEFLEHMNKHYNLESTTKYNTVISVELDQFEAATIERLSGAGHDIHKYLQRIKSQEFRAPNPVVYSYHPIRWILTALSLEYPLKMVPPTGRWGIQKGDEDDLSPGGWAKGRDRIETPFHGPIQYVTREPIDTAVLVENAKILEPYYRTIFWNVDRISIALHSFWAFLFSPFMEQAYVSLVTILEALLHEGKNEISHQIAERAALLLSNNGDERVKIYGNVKKLYGLRSEIAHGVMKPKKGSITWDSNIISATMSNISISQFKEMANLSIGVLRAAIKNEEIRTVMQAKRAEKVNDFFLRKIFSPNAV
jgi:hypothetical protein